MVVIAFFLCWTPFYAQRLGYVYFKVSTKQGSTFSICSNLGLCFQESLFFRTINEYLMYVSGIFYYVSSTINPILYNLMSVKYRRAFRRTLCGVPDHGNFALPQAFRGRTNTWESHQDLPLANRSAASARMASNGRQHQNRRDSSDSVIMSFHPSSSRVSATKHNYNRKMPPPVLRTGSSSALSNGQFLPVLEPMEEASHVSAGSVSNSRTK